MITNTDAAHASVAIRKRRESKFAAEPFECTRYIGKELYVVTSLDEHFERAISDRRLMPMMQSETS